MLKRVDLETLNIKNAYFHFTKTENLKRISDANLIPKIGKNAEMIEENEKVFFSIGADGVLKLHDVWLKWMMNRMFGEVSLRKKYDDDEYKNKLYEWTDEFLNKKYKVDVAKKNALFTKHYHDMLECSYLLLELTDGYDYDKNDYDEVKVRLNRNPNSLEYSFMKEMYGSYSDVTSNKMDAWNMHMIKNRYVKPRFISVVTINNNEVNVIDVLKFMYNKYKNIDYDLLDDFMVWLKNNEER